MKKDKNIKEIQEIKEDKTILMIRAITRSLGLLIPLGCLSAGMFLIPEQADIILGGIIGCIGTAGTFLYSAK